MKPYQYRSEEEAFLVDKAVRFEMALIKSGKVKLIPFEEVMRKAGLCFDD